MKRFSISLKNMAAKLPASLHLHAFFIPPNVGFLGQEMKIPSNGGSAGNYNIFSLQRQTKTITN